MQQQAEGERVIIRPLQKQFLSAYQAAFSPKVQTILSVSSVASELAYLHEQVEKQLNGQTFFFCVFDKQNDRLIGAIEIRHWLVGTNQLYNWLHEDYWGGGYYQEALKLVVKTYFLRTGRTFLAAHVDIDNKRSYFALKKHGFADWGICNGARCKQYILVLRRQFRD